jgi:tellurite resistance protein TehA-like permease
MESRWAWLRPAIRNLDPSYFGLVMATGIVSEGMRLDGAAALSGVLLGIAVVAYVALAVIYAWRLAEYPREVRGDAREPRRAFGFFTLAAASDVLAARLASDRHVTAAEVLLVIGGTSWVLLSYGLPMLVAGAERARPALADANGTWFLWPVGVQSAAVAVTSLTPPLPATLGAGLAVACWAVGVVLYLLVAALVTAALLTAPVRPAELTPAYWVFMGATAISVLAGTQLLRVPSGPLLAAVHAVVAGLSVMLWAFGTWLIPLLVAVGVWRHLLRRVPLAYEPGWWSIAFPVGMYGVASHELGAALKVPWLVTLGRGEAWAALAVWALVLLAMGAAPLRRLGAWPRPALRIRR